MSSNVTDPKVGIIVQARSGSTRLPGKIFKELAAGETVLSYLLARLSTCKLVDCIIVATTTNPQDNSLVEWLKANHYHFYRGDEENCLDRFYQTIKTFEIDIAVRITSDCPLVAPEIIDDMIQYYLNNRQQVDYLSNRQFTNFPEGLDTEIFSFKILEEAAYNADKQEEREHINYYFLNRPSQYKIRYYNHSLGFDYSRFKLSIDTLQDLNYIRSIFVNKNLPFDFSFKELIEVLIEFAN